MRRPGRAAAFLETVLRLELRRAVLWLPVGLGIGIWVYFELPEEPADWCLGLPLLPAVILLAPVVRRSMAGRVLGLGALALTLGFALALGAAMRAEGPRFARALTASVEGRVVALDKAASGAPRILLERVSLFGYGPRRVPERVRLALLDTDPQAAPRPGDWVHVHATLFPPGAPVEPGAFESARRASGVGVGATGPAPPPAMRLPAAEAVGTRAEAVPALPDRLRLRLARARQAMADGIRAALPGASGAFAAAIIVGDRAGIEEADAEALRISSLAHLLAISGLHMGMLTGLVFTALRAGMALAGPVALRLPAKKLAAGAALLAGLGYLALSGGTVATQRAFVMVAVALVAVMLDRPAITLRALALAAAIVLTLNPAALFDAGFQMSFAATTALVAAYEALRRRRAARAAAAREAASEGDGGRPSPSGDPPPAHAVPDGLRGSGAWRLLPAAVANGLVVAAAGRLWALFWAGLGALLLTSVVAGAATAPFAGVHFNRATPWGLLANLGAVPVMGLWIAPSAILAGLLAPFGFAEPALALMGLGIDWVLGVAHRVAALPGADTGVPAAPVWLLGTLALGGLWAAVWRGPWRVAGLAAAFAAVLAAHWHAPVRPALVIAPEGRLFGVLGPEGRALDRATGQGHAAETWLRRDGERPPQAVAAARPGFAAGAARRDLTAPLPEGWRLVLRRGRGATAAESMAQACVAHTVLVVPRAKARPAGACVFIGAGRLGRGAVAIWIENGEVRTKSSAASGKRRWHPGWRAGRVSQR
ncbi:MAG: ComEC/Rec2 family competence protein [Pseudomonadota bacterium]